MATLRTTRPARAASVVLHVVGTLAAVSTLLIPVVMTPAAVAAGATASPAKVIRVLNAERRANGIPAGIKVSSIWSTRCHKHDHYMAVNNVLTHYEEPSKPGYTKGGAWAGEKSVLEYGSTWLDGDPYDQAPLHFAQLMQPRLVKSGAYELRASGTIWGCTTTWPGFTRPDPANNRVFTYPGNGTKGVRYSYHASEFPKTPNDIVGAPNNCGQELFVYFSGPALPREAYPSSYADVRAASLRPKGGKTVAVKVADGRTKTPKSMGGYPLGAYIGPGAAIVIPVKPLKPSTTYVARVTIKIKGVSLTHKWHFRTRPKS